MTKLDTPMQDTLGCLAPDGDFRVEGALDGPLAGLTFAAKDIYDVAGRVTGCGNPDWARTHPPAERHAWAVERWLEAGATLTAKTITDELAYSLNGRNFHYGTPTNPNAPGRIPGGSSSGSASAVAGGLVDIALGSDTGGSVRVPAGFCGLYGMRPTHGRIPLEGVMPLAPSFDTVGAFARDAETLGRAMRVLLRSETHARPPQRLLIGRDALALADAVASVLDPLVERCETRFGGAGLVDLGEPGGGLEAWMWRFRRIQAREIATTHGAWIAETRPRFGPEIQERFDWALEVGEAQAAHDRAMRKAFRARLEELLDEETVLLIPTAPSIAPRCDSEGEALLAFRSRGLSLTSIAGLSGFPQITLPLARHEGCPVGLSFIGPLAGDEMLLDLAISLERELETAPVGAS